MSRMRRYFFSPTDPGVIGACLTGSTHFSTSALLGDQHEVLRILGRMWDRESIRPSILELHPPLQSHVTDIDGVEHVFI